MDFAKDLTNNLGGITNTLGNGQEPNAKEQDTDQDITKDVSELIIENIKKEYFTNPNDTPENINAQIKSDLLVVYYEDNDLSKKKVDRDLKNTICRMWYNSLSSRNSTIIREFFNKKPQNVDKTPNSASIKNDSNSTEDTSASDMLTKISNESAKVTEQVKSVGVRGHNEVTGEDLRNAVGLVSSKDNESPPMASIATGYLQNAMDLVSSKDNMNNPGIIDAADIKVVLGKTPSSLVNNIDMNSINDAMSSAKKTVESLAKNADKTTVLNNIRNNPENFTENPLLKKVFITKGGTKTKEEIAENIAEYKYDQFADAYFKNISIDHAATNPQIKNMHNKLITTVLCTYSITNLKDLSTNLKQILFGGSDNKDIYSIFKSKLDLLADKDKNSKSNPIIRKQSSNEAQPLNGGAGSEYPSRYIWKRIQQKVDTSIGDMVREKMKPMYDAIQTAFKDVFLQSNCDALDLDSGDTMDSYLQSEYATILENLCKHIPNEKAQLILQSYILRNYGEFVEYLKGSVFAHSSNQTDVFVNHFASLPDKMFSDAQINPVCPEIKREKILPDNNTDDLDKCCEERNGEKGLSSGGVSEWPKVKNIRDNGILNYIVSKPATLLPVFNVLKNEFTKCVNDDKTFLSKLFNMYSGKSIKFMKQVKLQFERVEVEDYIERYILTKHPHTKRIIEKCIIHAADVKLTIFKKENLEKDEPNALISKYSVFLMYLCCVKSAEKPTEPVIEYVKHQLTQPPFQSLMKDTDIKDNIMEKIPNQHKITYKNDLENVLGYSRS